MERTRRAVLGGLSAAVAGVLAGCLSGSDGGGGATPTTGTPDDTTPTRDTPTTSTDTATTDTPPDDPEVLAAGESYETGSGATVTVENVTYRRAVVEFGTTHPDPLYEPGGGFVVADVAVSGDDPPDPAKMPVFLGTDTTDRSTRRYVFADSNVDERRQRFAFPAPASPAPSAGAVVWAREDASAVEWTLPDSVVAAIADPPVFELREVAVQDAPGDEVAVTVTVANVGGRDGVFLAEAGDATMSDQPEVQVAVPAGETVTATRRVWAEFRDHAELTVVVRWRDTTVERTLQRE